MKSLMPPENTTTMHLNEQKDLFVATLVHDLKNPLKSQLSGLNLLANGTFGEVNEKQKEIINLIGESVSFLNNLIYSALDIYKYENGRQKLNKNIFDIDLLLKKCVKEFVFCASEKNVVVSYDNLASFSLINADEYKIRRIISNILSNAITHSYRNSTVNISLSEHSESLIAKISNNGDKIPEEIQKHIFDEFVSSTGTGLGLYCCKKFTEEHGGTIFLESSEKETSFIVKLPRDIKKKHSA